MTREEAEKEFSRLYGGEMMEFGLDPELTDVLNRYIEGDINQRELIELSITHIQVTNSKLRQIIK